MFKKVGKNMNQGMQLYYDYTVSPIGELFYKTVFDQLNDIKNKTILDFGSGFAFTSDFLAKNNTVTAIEKEQSMIAVSRHTNQYAQINGDLKNVKEMADNSFDVVICHLVLEFVDNPQEILLELLRVLKPGGTLSVIRHNKNGRIIQAVVQDYDLDDANKLLAGGYSYSSAFGDIKYYENQHLQDWSNNTLELAQVYGVRTLASLHSPSIKAKDDWVSDMQSIEKQLNTKEEFISISYFNHMLFKKK